MGRPEKDIDEKQVELLASYHCTIPEIAAVVGCGVTTIKRRFGPTIERGREAGKGSLKRRQFELAMAGNATMLIWLGKQHLEQREPRDIGMEFDEVKRRLAKQIDQLREALPPEEAEKAIAAIRPVWLAA